MPRRPTRSPVHPRIRGERSSPNPCTTRNSGSSPHTRGTLPVDGTVHPDKRFIPAYAGNASIVTPRRRAMPVHPRIRGERPTSAILGRSQTGSSPHTRGTRPRQGCRSRGRRFIPAYAGNANWAPPRTSAPAVHPRIRGERGPVFQVLGVQLGSSPHTRGTRAICKRSLKYSRFIPAYAGNARDWSRQSGKPSVHPRIRGERC